eukprot:353620-Prymnesium_polylepis.1
MKQPTHAARAPVRLHLVILRRTVRLDRGALVESREEREGPEQPRTSQLCNRAPRLHRATCCCARLA